jgi:hypothetical protein
MSAALAVQTTVFTWTSLKGQELRQPSGALSTIEG